MKRVILLRRMSWVGHVAGVGEVRSESKFLIGKPEGKRPLGKPRHRWYDNSMGCELDSFGSG
jgi:hypothetical protein